ncbi:hypothetical protein LTR17_002517 [Elasticomyces elasticus]|nr:hypothetical protein LTR17_002517 [Elasticomyces elasticus]
MPMDWIGQPSPSQLARIDQIFAARLAKTKDNTSEPVTATPAATTDSAFDVRAQILGHQRSSPMAVAAAKRNSKREPLPEFSLIVSGRGTAITAEVLVAPLRTLVEPQKLLFLSSASLGEAETPEKAMRKLVEVTMELLVREREEIVVMNGSVRMG